MNSISPDQQTIAEVLSGRTEAFRMLVERHQGSVFRLVRAFATTAEDQEDLAQDTFVAALEHLHRYDAAKSCFATWLLRICRNRCVNWVKRKRIVCHQADLGDNLLASSSTASVEAPDRRAMREDLRRQLDQALAELPIEQRTALVLADIEGLPYEQIADIEGVSLGAVKSRIHRARKQMKSILEPLAEHW